MATVTNLVPIRIDALSSDNAVRIIDTLLIDTSCLPVSHAVPHNNGTSRSMCSDNFSISSLVDANASNLAESILADAEVQGVVRSSKTFLGGRLDLLGDSQLYREIKRQIREQLGIALSVDKEKLISSGKTLLGIDGGSDVEKCDSSTAMETDAVPDNTLSSGDGIVSTQLKSGLSSKNVKIKLRIRHENIAMVDEFDYDIGTSGLEGSCPISLANSIVQDLKLPLQFAPSITSSIVEQIYGVEVPESLDELGSEHANRKIPAAFSLEITQDGASSNFAQMMLDSS